MLYAGYHFLGMHLVWWFIWTLLLFWVFITPYSIPGELKRKNSAIDILQKRFITGKISLQEFKDKVAVLREDE